MIVEMLLRISIRFLSLKVLIGLEMKGFHRSFLQIVADQVKFQEFK